MFEKRVSKNIISIKITTSAISFLNPNFVRELFLPLDEVKISYYAHYINYDKTTYPKVLNFELNNELLEYHQSEKNEELDTLEN